MFSVLFPSLVILCIIMFIIMHNNVFARLYSTCGWVLGSNLRLNPSILLEC